jgi:organic hydroperoxide reductase OsmC/OhrA
MHDLPHLYSATASAQAEGDVSVDAERLPSLSTAAPAQFGGPGDHWSPEMLLVAAVADCAVLTFRAIARASKLPWHDLSCEVEGTLDRVDRIMQFTRFTVWASLTVPPGTDEARARKLLKKADETCLTTRALKAPSVLDARVVVSSG